MVEQQLAVQELTGKTVGRYDVGQPLGVGGMAVVYDAVQRPLGREVALKVLTTALVNREGFLQRFENEARTVARLDHPNILPVFDFGRQDGITYIAMPVVRGGTLRDRVRLGPMQPSLAWKMLTEIAAGLQHAHDAGVIHRDLKPSNILVTPDGRCLLADFGLARQGDVRTEHSMYGVAMGTPGFMSPEQAMGKDVDLRADIFSLGALFYTMLAGEAPFSGSTAMEIVIASVSLAAPSLRERNPGVPAGVDAALAVIMAKDPQQRPASVRAALKLLAELPSGQMAHLTPAAPSPVPAPPALHTPAPAPGQVTPLPSPVPSAPPLPSSGAQPAMAGANPPSGTSAVSMLMGIEKFEPQQQYFLNSHFAMIVNSARVVSGSHWPDLVAAAAMPEYTNRDPADNSERATPIDRPSKLEDAFEQVFGNDSPDRLREWGRLVTERSRVLHKRPHSERRLISKPGQKVGLLLKNFTTNLDEVRGEHLHASKQIDAEQFWTVHHANLHALGRRRSQKSCHYWVASYEAILRRAGLLNTWRVEEVECGCVTGLFDCTFAVKSLR